MEVVNVRVKYIRPKYADLAAWMADPENLYVGRGGIVFIAGERFPKESSPFCNPFKTPQDGDRATVIAKYRAYLRSRPDLCAALRKASLGKKRLGCWCKPEACHGDVLAEFLQEPGPISDGLDESK